VGRTVTRYAIGAQAAAADPEATTVMGNDRYGTAAAVAQRFFPHPTEVGVAIGSDFPDSLVAAPFLGASGQPLLLVDGGEVLPPDVEQYLEQRSSGIRHLTVFGGTATLQEGGHLRPAARAAVGRPLRS